MGAPYWNPYARGTIVGITRGCQKEHFIRATLESIAYQTADVLRAMEEDAGMPLQELKVDGGASANDFLMQFQADIIGQTVHRPSCIETFSISLYFCTIIISLLPPKSMRILPLFSNLLTVLRVSLLS